MKPYGGNQVGLGMRNFRGTVKSSVRYQLPTFTLVPVGLQSSIASVSGGSVCARISLITIGACGPSSGSACPGVPPSVPFGRQLVFSPHNDHEIVSSTITSG